MDQSVPDSVTLDAAAGLMGLQTDNPINGMKIVNHWLDNHNQNNNVDESFDKEALNVICLDAKDPMINMNPTSQEIDQKNTENSEEKLMDNLSTGPELIQSSILAEEKNIPYYDAGCKLQLPGFLMAPNSVDKWMRMVKKLKYEPHEQNPKYFPPPPHYKNYMIKNKRPILCRRINEKYKGEYLLK